MAQYERLVYVSEDGFWCDPIEGCLSERIVMPVLEDRPWVWDDDGPHLPIRERHFYGRKVRGDAPITDAVIGELTGAEKVDT